jgi:hypothetical protein
MAVDGSVSSREEMRRCVTAPLHTNRLPAPVSKKPPRIPQPSGVRAGAASFYSADMGHGTWVLVLSPPPVLAIVLAPSNQR